MPVQIGPTNGIDPDLMCLECHPTVLKHMVECGRKMVKVYIENHLLLNPTCKCVGDFHFHTKPEQFPSGAAVYARLKLNKNGRYMKVRKVGSTSNMMVRFQHYLDDHGKGVKIIVVLPFDSVPFEVDVKVKGVFHEFLKAVLYDKDVPGPMKQHFHMLRNRGGLPLGSDRRMTLACAETGIQDWLGLDPLPSEAGLFDEQVYYERIDFVDNSVDHAVDLLSFFSLRECPPSSKDSWTTAHTGETRPMYRDLSEIETLSSQACLGEYVIGTNLSDALPFPASPGSTTNELAFSTEGYSVVGKFLCFVSLYRYTFDLVSNL